MWGYTPDKIVIAIITNEESTITEEQWRLYQAYVDAMKAAFASGSWTYTSIPTSRAILAPTGDTNWAHSPEWQQSHQDPEYDRDREDIRERDRYQDFYDEPRDDYDPVAEMHEQWSRSMAGA